MSTPKSLRRMTIEGATEYHFSHTDATGFPRLLPPARKIGLGRRALAGMMPSGKGTDSPSARFESSLERDFFVLLEFNTNVLRWDAQPIRLDVGDGAAPYVPDVLVTYLGPSRAIDDTNRVLYEVKYRDELRRRWAQLRPRYRAAWRFAKAHGWQFKLITEREIRTELLWNAKFLLPYLHDQACDEDCQRLLDALQSVDKTTPGELLKMCANDRLVQARLLTSLWYLVSMRMVEADLTRRVNMRTPIWYYAS